MSAYCAEALAELRAMGWELDLLSIDDDGDVVHVVLWTEDGPLVMAIGERFVRARQH
jgi:hypothetical protein